METNSNKKINPVDYEGDMASRSYALSFQSYLHITERKVQIPASNFY